MDDELVSLLQVPAVAAAYFGQDWVNDHYEPGSRDNSCYSGFVLLIERCPLAWWTYYEAYVLPQFYPNSPLPSPGRMQGLLDHLEKIWRELGFQ